MVNDYGLSNNQNETIITLRKDFRIGSTTGNASIPTSEKMDKGFKTAPIKLNKLDDIWVGNYQDLEDIDIVKMDIEGHEDFCIIGAKQTFKKYRPTILMEVAKSYYIERGVSLDKTFFPIIPDNYSLFCKKNKQWIKITTLENCKNIDNVFWIPNEKLLLKKYQLFKQ